MKIAVLSLALAAAGAETAVAAQPAAPPPPPAQSGGRPVPPVRVFISPMGEPFRRDQGPGEPIDRWFQGADTDRDGALSVLEFQADAARFFATLDVNHDNEIAPDEMGRYETEVAPEVQLGRNLGLNLRNRRPRPGEGAYGMGTQSLLAIPQPVISADTDLNRGVSTAEFRHAAGQRFLMLDRNRDGRITREELNPPPEERGRRR